MIFLVLAGAITDVNGIIYYICRCVPKYSEKLPFVPSSWHCLVGFFHKRHFDGPVKHNQQTRTGQTGIYPKRNIDSQLVYNCFNMAVLELGVFGAFMASSELTPTSTIIYFPFIFVNIFIPIFGTSLALGALNTYYRKSSISGQLFFRLAFLRVEFELIYRLIKVNLKIYYFWVQWQE